jgi:hypothetical protein
MTKKTAESTVHRNSGTKSAKHKPDSELNLSDFPEATDDELRRARRVGRAAIIGLGKFRSGIPDFGSNKKHLIVFGLPPESPRVSAKKVAKLDAEQD